MRARAKRTIAYSATVIRSERGAAGLLLAAALLGLMLANSGAGAALITSKHAVPFAALPLSWGHWISDGLLAIFFFMIAVELKHELVVGQLNSVRKALAPAVAALGGVIVPAGIYLLVTRGSGFEGGWPIPTATDIAFSLGLLAVFGRGLPGIVRIFLLALAVLDDLVAIVIIAVFFTSSIDFGALAIALVAIAAFGVLSRFGTRWLRDTLPSGRGQRMLVQAGLVVLALLSWYFVYSSGVHATLAGVGLGLVMARQPARTAAHAIEPFSNGFVLPLFAFSAALVAFPAIDSLSAIFPGIVVALVVGKIVGITLGGLLIFRMTRDRSQPSVSLGNLVTVGALGGIGFTVSLLMAELSFPGRPAITDEATLAVLLGSGISMVLAIVMLRWRVAHYRRAAHHPAG